MSNIVAILLDEKMSAARLGELLRAARKRRGWKRKQAAVETGISADALRAYERGTRTVPSDVCARLAESYGEDLSTLVAPRLPVDQVMMAGTSEEILADYVQLVRRLRDAKPGEPLPLRAHDVAALASALETDDDAVELRIMAALGCERAEAHSLHRELLRRRIVLPVAGLAASVVALAGVQAAHASNTPARRDAPVVKAGPVTAPPTTEITVAPTTTVVPVFTPPTTTPVLRVVPAPSAQTEEHHPVQLPPPVTPHPPQLTPPSIPHEDTPVGVLPGEHPIDYTPTSAPQDADNG
jgi:transcriptional regulator with XRE-family HTH domain